MKTLHIFLVLSFFFSFIIKKQTFSTNILFKQNFETKSNSLQTPENSIQVISVISNDTVCNGENNGEITVTYTASGNEILERGIFWSTQLNPELTGTKIIDGSGDGTFTNPYGGFGSGTYYIEAYIRTENDSFIYSNTNIISIQEYELIQYSFNQSGMSCHDRNDGNVTVYNVTGGKPPYQYMLEGPYEYENHGVWQQDSVFSNLVMGFYSIYIKDQNGCISNYIESFEIENPDVLFIDYTFTFVFDRTIFIESDGTGGTLPYKYSYYVNKNPGQFTVDLLDDLNWYDSDEFEISVLDYNTNYFVTLVIKDANDCIGISSEHEFETSSDLIFPVINCPPDYSVSCTLDDTPYFTFQEFLNAGGVATDNYQLDTSSFIFHSETRTFDTCQTNVIRTYRIGDINMNTSECAQTILIDDTISPSISCSVDIIYNSGSTDDLENLTTLPYSENPTSLFLSQLILAGGSAEDNCVGTDLKEISYVDSKSGTNPILVLRTFTAIDSCGNKSQCQQLIELAINEQLSLDCPSEWIVNSIDEIPEPYHNYIDFNNNGGEAISTCGIDTSSFTLVKEFHGVSECPGKVIYYYLISDNCGNQTSCTHEIIINDTISPQISCPPDTNVVSIETIPDYYGSFNDFVAAGGVANDNNKLDESSFNLMSESWSVYSSFTTINRTYEIADDCGNIATCEQELFIEESTPNSMRCPPEVKVSCNSEIPSPFQDYSAFVNSGGSAFSECGINISSFSFISETTDGNMCPETRTRIYEISDSCGSYITCSQNIVVNDTEPPKFSITPKDTIVECFEDIPIPQVIQVSDNCGPIPVTFTENVTDFYCENFQTIIRTWIAQDKCGNVTKVTQTINVIDIIPPVLSATPNDITVSCYEQVPQPDVLYATDNSMSVPVTFTENVTDFSCENNQTIIRTWIAQDKCGNQSTVNQTITVIDTIAPVLSQVPNDTVVACLNDLPPYALSVTAIDNCGFIPVDFNEVMSDSSCSNILTITRTWNAADECGNATTASQIISVIDTLAPEASGISYNISVNNFDEVPAPYNSIADMVLAGIEITDCSSNLTVNTFDIDTIINDEHFPEIIRFYEIYDDCRNTLSWEQIITITDTSAFIISCPSDTIQNCLELPHAFPEDFLNAGGEFYSYWGVDSIWLVSENRLSQSCPIYYEREYKSRNSFGILSQTCKQVIGINDLVDPKLYCPPDTTVKSAANIPERFLNIESLLDQGGSVNDNCKIDTMTFNMISEFTDTLPETDVIMRTYYIADNCINEDICLHKVYISNSTSSPEIEMNKNNLDLSVFPNPNSGQFKLRFENGKPGEIKIQIINELGQIQLEKEIYINGIYHEEEFDLSHLPKGNYFIKTFDEVNINSRKIILF